MVNDLTTVALVKAYMKKTDATDDALLAVLVSQASMMIEKYTNIDFTAVDYADELYDGNGGPKLYLKHWPINSVTSVILYDPQNDSDLYTYTVNTEYILYEKDGYIHMWGGWSRGHQNFKITYNAGYATVPEDIVLAANMLTAFVFDNIRKQGIKSQRIGTFSETLRDITGSIPIEVSTMLDLWRRPVYAFDIDE